MKNGIENSREKIDVAKFLFSEKMDAFFFAVVCATVFVSACCHWLLDFGTAYRLGIDSDGIVDFKTVLYLGIIITLYYMIKAKKVVFDFIFCFLCQGLLLVAVLDYHKQSYPDVIYAILLPTAYIVGKLAIGQDIAKAGKRAEALFLSLMFGGFIVSSLDFYNNFRLASVNGFQTEEWVSFWLGGLVENRCTYEMGFIFTTCAVGYGLMRLRKCWILSLFIILSNVYIQYCDIAVTGRENRLLLPINILIVVLMYLWSEWSNITKVQRIIVYSGVIIVLFGIVLFILAFIFNWFGLYDWYLNSNWSTTGGIFTNVRFKLDWDGFKAMLKYPLDDYLGKVNIRRPHSLMLEYGRIYDLTIYGILVIARLIMFKDAIKIALNKSEYSWVKYFLVPAFLSVNIYYSLEPNGIIHRHFWMAGLLISGIIRGWLELNNSNNNISTNNDIKMIKNRVL